MRKMYILGALGLHNMIAMQAEAEQGSVEDTKPVEAAAPVAEAPKERKSIVPARYAGKYKAGGNDALAEFINKQARGKDGFEYGAFFELCRKNGLAEEKVAHYQAQVAEKRHGAQGRARMTLRNMLATIARKNGKLVGLDGAEVAIDMPKVELTGAAKAAQEAKTEAPAEAGSTEGEGDANTAEGGEQTSQF